MNVVDKYLGNSHGYDMLEECIDTSFNSYHGKKVFTTDSGKLFVLFLKYLPEEFRQYYNCNCCKAFVNKYAGLVSIEDDGTLHPIMWKLYDETPNFFRRSIEAIREQVIHSTVTGVFYTNEDILGTHESNGWGHMHAKVRHIPSGIRPKQINTPYQEKSEKLENFKLLKSSLRKYSLDSIKRAVTLLDTGSLYRSDKVLPNAKWFIKMKQLKPVCNGRLYKNLLWREVANASEGFCHVSSNMLGTLLDDITAGLHIDEVKRKFKKKMNPNIGGYQRPSSAPSEGNIDQAEKIIEKLGIKDSFLRRYATIFDVPLIWHPSDSDFISIDKGGPVMDGSVFSHLRNNKTRSITSIDSMESVVMNWRDFKDNVLPNAEEISCFIGSGNLPLTAMVTNEKNSPPILKWDTEEDRNPLSSYVYIGGSPASRWRLTPREYVKVTGIANKPSIEKKDGIIFILEGCKDLNHMNAGLALFPEILKSELHSIRKTIEAYSRSKQLTGFEGSTACGIAFNNECPVLLKVTTDGETVPYKIDRW
jgi:hypothetical protein